MAAADQPGQLDDRLDQAHRPYHRAIEEQIALLLDRFGCALLIDCHSMPPPPAGTPPIVFGDRRGRTADAWVSRAALEIARGCGLRRRAQRSLRGRPCDRASRRPARGVHALQLEVDRRCYLDATLREPGPGFDRAAAFIDPLAVELGEALLGRQYATAAE